nr:hypothetical protein [Candidatus Sigynarchaeota archaeon]
MPAFTKELLSETLDLVLQQQFISDTGGILNRTKKESFNIPGTKFTYVRIKNAILEGAQYVLSEQIDKFIEFLAGKFRVPRKVFDDKLASLGDQLLMMDMRMKLVMILSTLREYWQDIAYQKVIEEICHAIAFMGLDINPPTAAEVKQIVSTDFGPDYSMLVNIYVLMEMGKLAGTLLKADDAWFEMMDRLAAEVVTKLSE